MNANLSHYEKTRWQKLLHLLAMKPWHRFAAWRLSGTIRQQRWHLAKYIRRSAYEIAAWKQDIAFLDEHLEYHLTRAGFPLPVTPDGGKVVSMANADPQTAAGRTAAG